MPSPLSAPLATRTQARARTSCEEHPRLYLDPMMEQPPAQTASVEARRRYRTLESHAERLCHACPLLESCLYRAVVEHDVTGFVAGATERQRLEIRRRLGVTVEPEDLDTLAGVTRKHRQVDHEEVVRLRRANPTESLERIARRLGCSLSTVKRHLRKERAATLPAPATPQRPSPAAVTAVYAEIVASSRRRVHLAA